MKIHRVFLILTITMFLSIGVFASNPQIKIVIDENELKTNTPSQAINNRTLVPLREIFEAMGAIVNWDRDTKVITAVKGSDEVNLEIGNVHASINGHEVKLDTPALAIKGVTLVPVRFIAESFGSQVIWDDYDQTVYITTKDKIKVNRDDEYLITEFTNSRHFEFNKSIGEITGYSKDGPKDLVIPDRIAGTTVRSIGENSFSYKKLKSIKIPDSITKIGNESFANNNLTKVNIPTNITYIGKRAFANNKIQTLNIEKGVKELDDGAFNNNSLMILKLPESTKSIGNYTFSSNKLKTISLNDGILNIGIGAFSDNNLTRTNIPSSVRSIGDGAYRKNNIRTIYVPIYTKLHPDAFDSWVNIVRN